MKKILALILCLAMVFSLTAVLAGCGDEEEDTKDKTSDVDKDTEKEDKEDADKDEEEEVKDASIYNTWEGEMDYAPVLKAMFAEVGDDDLANILTPKSFKIAMILEFDEEGTVKLEVDKKSMEKAMEILSSYQADFIATDAHSPYSRTPYLADVHEFISEEISPEYGDVLIKVNPRKVLNDEKIYSF